MPKIIQSTILEKIQTKKDEGKLGEETKELEKIQLNVN